MFLALATVLGAIAIGSGVGLAGNFAVTPPRLEFNIESSGKNESIRLTNADSEPLEIQVSTSNWVQDENNQVQIVDSTEKSLDRWLLINPLRFTIPPGKSQTVRIAVRPRVKPEEGEHRAMIFFEEVPSAKNKSVAAVVIGRLGVAVYGYTGNINRIGVLNSVQVEAQANPVTAIFDISSQGNAHVRMAGEYAIWSAEKYPGAAATKPIPNLATKDVKLPDGVWEASGLPTLPILPNNRRKLPLNTTKKLPPGKYVLDINGDLSGTPIDEGIPFTIAPSAQELRIHN
ncbi:MAG: molecular chaperone [Microcoleus sp. T1-bin1]|nr:molecular chaperone [Microcoleus sp. T1-bin1]